MRGARSARRLAAAVALASFGCVSTQSVQIDCVPQRALVYVDGRLLEEPVGDVVLRTDQPHKIYVKAPGYQPHLVVLAPMGDPDGRERLDADEVCLEPMLVGQQREVEVHAEEPEPSEGATSPGRSPGGSR